MIHLSNVEYHYGSTHALGPVELKIERGEFFAVVGPSGCGKSTLLDLLAGLIEPQFLSKDGGILYNPYKRATAMVFQQDATFPWMNVRENVAFGLNPATSSVDEVIERVGLSSFSRMYPSQLSGGMRQRVCLARAFARRPRLLLLDEPFGSLDHQTRILMGDDLLTLWRETKATVVLVTHSIDEAAMLADRVGVMSAGPGKFIDTIKTFWPANRGSSVLERTGEITNRIWCSLRPQAMLAMGR